jgi:hypothetical protein
VLADVGVDGGEDVVEEDDAVLGLEAGEVDGARQRDALLLAAAKVDSLLSYLRHIARCYPPQAKKIKYDVSTRHDQRHDTTNDTTRHATTHTQRTGENAEVFGEGAHADDVPIQRHV